MSAVSKSWNGEAEKNFGYNIKSASQYLKNHVFDRADKNSGMGEIVQFATYISVMRRDADNKTYIYSESSRTSGER